jgi:Flp pilus assembly protein TadG
MKVQAQIGKLKSQSGQVLVLLAFGLVALIGMAGVVVDGGRSYADQRSLEAAAEAGAHAGAYLMEKSWNGEAGNFGSLTGTQVVATAQAFAGYNGWSSTDSFYLDYVKPDRTTHVATLDNTVRGVLVQVSKPQTATFTRVLGFKLYSVFARATAMFGAALLAGALPLAIDDSCTPGYDINVGAQPANFGGSFGTCNFASIVPPGCVAGDSACYQNAMTNGMNPPTQLGPAYPVNSFDMAALSALTAAALQARITARPGETCTTFKSPSPRVIWMPVVAGGFGGATVVFIRYRAFFLTSISSPNGFTGCFVHATINGGDFDPNAVGTAYGGVMIMKLIRSTGAVVPVNVTLTALTNPAVRGTVNGSTLTIHTNQVGASCTVLVFDLPPAAAPAPSAAAGLGPKITDGSGNATWTWTVEATALIGLAQIQVSCTWHGELGYLFTSTIIA